MPDVLVLQVRQWKEHWICLSSDGCAGVTANVSALLTAMEMTIVDFERVPVFRISRGLFSALSTPSFATKGHFAAYVKLYKIISKSFQILEFFRIN